MTPRIVMIDGVKTPANVPNFFRAAMRLRFHDYRGDCNASPDDDRERSGPGPVTGDGAKARRPGPNTRRSDKGNGQPDRNNSAWNTRAAKNTPAKEGHVPPTRPA